MNDKQLAASVVNEVKKAVVGKDEMLIKALLAILSRGHILLEDIPGVGKTTMALAISRALGLSYRRVQFTPDVMPSDLTGFSLYNKETRQLEYQPGALLCNLFLADELNRATSRTQSALLEAMEEGQVTVDGVTHAIPSGTQLLPDSQLDRFALRLSLGYPSAQDEVELLRRKQKGEGLSQVRQVMDHRQLAYLRELVDQVFIDEEVLAYIVRLIRSTREHPQLLQGASPRASIAVAALSRATAFLRGRDFVIPEDVQYIWTDAVAHRLLLPAGAVGGAERLRQIAGEVMNRVHPPRIR